MENVFKNIQTKSADSDSVFVTPRSEVNYTIFEPLPDISRMPDVKVARKYKQEEESSLL